jgi:hypothetical protein
MHPFMIEQLTYQHTRDLKARASKEALVGLHKGASGRRLPLLSCLGVRLRGRRRPARLLAPVVPLSTARRSDAVARGREAS